jgi:hypothetical protein
MNHGDSPALNVHVSGKLVATGPNRDMKDHYVAYCKEDRCRYNSVFSDDIFPAGTSLHGISLPFDKGEIDEFHNVMKAAYEHMEDAPEHIPTELYISVTYDSTADNERKQTAMRFFVPRYDPEYPNRNIALKIGESLAQNEITLRRQALGSGQIS